MRLLDFFRSSHQSSASVAKERLQILVAHQRSARQTPSYLPMMQQELLEVVRKYVGVTDDAITLNIDQDADHEVLELNIVLPEQEENRRSAV